jgi:LPXTG-site transpeptidase (sortase) family protein
MNYAITEREVRSILQEAPRKGRLFLAMGVATLIVIAGVWGGFSNLSPTQATATNGIQQSAPVAGFAPVSPSAQASQATPEPTATPLPVTLPESTFNADDLNISAPITWNVPLEQNVMNEDLKQGLIHIEGTAVPGQRGVVAIAGHSSNYAWIKSDYNSIFAPLVRSAAIGQIYQINYKNVMYEYKVSKIFTISPDDSSVLTDTSFTGLNLITCTPVGTSLKRAITQAVQIFPDPALATPFTVSTSAAPLPSDQ